jgi:hypothetical protein
MLRRSKSAVEDQLALPPCAREDLAVDLSVVERAFYDVLKVGRGVCVTGGPACVWVCGWVWRRSGIVIRTTAARAWGAEARGANGRVQRVCGSCRTQSFLHGQPCPARVARLVVPRVAPVAPLGRCT